MMSNKFRLAVMFICWSMSAAVAQSTSGNLSSDEANKVALDSLGAYKRVTATSTSGQVVLDVPGAPPTKLGEPIRDYTIELDALKAWDGKDVRALFKPTGRLIYPVTSEGNVKSSITLSSGSGNWEAVALGGPSAADVKTFAPPRGANGDGVIMSQVRVPALNVIFLAEEKGDVTKLTSTVSKPDLGIEAGQQENAYELLKKLQPDAKDTRSDVPN